jgi:hypothetical protein
LPQELRTGSSSIATPLAVQPKEKNMAQEIRFKIDTAVVAHKDFEIVVRTDKGKLATLLISRGNVEWLQMVNPLKKKRLSWVKFAEFMEDLGKPAKAK